ncbi:MAG: DUF1501 domain-containing protein [Verrucomicrobiota bacterium]
MNLTRRYFLKSSGALAVYCGVNPLNPYLLAEPGQQPVDVKKGKTLVVIFLRGGTDGLNLVVPHGDDHYYKVRKNIAIPKPGKNKGAIDLDGFFGLHPSAAPMAPLFEEGVFQALHAVGYDHNTRSHFEEQDVWETGVIGNTVQSDGWLNRHLQTSKGHGLIRALAIGDTLPRILHGKSPAYAVRGISDLSLPPSSLAKEGVFAALEHAYMPSDRNMARDGVELVHQTGTLTLEGVKLLEKIKAQPYQPNAEYPKDGFANKLKEAARLIKANIGLEVIEVDLGGWDTHNRQGGVEGTFANKVNILSESVKAFTQDLGSHLDDTLIMTLSDFGRTARENGSQGTDHGWANCLFMGGGPVKKLQDQQSKPVISEWPGLAPELLHQKRDLQHTTDFRDVLAEVVREHLGNPNLEKVLPGYEFQKLGLLTPS